MLSHKAIGFDVDGVIANYVAHVKRYSKWAGTDTMPSVYNLVNAGMFDTFKEFWETHTRVSLESALTPVMDSTVADVTRQLKAKGHRVAAITARDKDLCGDQTLEFFDRNGIAVDEVIFSDDKTAHGVDVMLDDHPGNVAALVEAGVPVVLRDSTYAHEIADYGLTVGPGGDVPVARSAADYYRLLTSSLI